MSRPVRRLDPPGLAKTASSRSDYDRECDRARGARPRPVRSLSINARLITKGDLRVGLAMYPEAVVHPETRGDCKDGPRPCPMVGCKHHLFLDVNPRNGTIKLNFPDLEPEQLVVSCALDVADRGGVTLQRLGSLMNITRERIRQVERIALKKLKPHAERLR